MSEPPAWGRIVKRKNGDDWELGSGNFGKVLRGLRGDVQPVAIKTTFKRDKQMEDAFIREIAMMKCGPLRSGLSLEYGTALSASATKASIVARARFNVAAVIVLGTDVYSLVSSFPLRSYPILRVPRSFATASRWPECLSTTPQWGVRCKVLVKLDGKYDLVTLSYAAF